MCAGDILILAVECYGWLSLGLWLSVTPAGILRRLTIVIPPAPWGPVQSMVDSLFHLPISAVFIWCGFNIAAMAWIVRKRLEWRILTSSASQVRSVHIQGRKNEEYVNPAKYR
jgi:hypothetical protein